MEVIVTGGRDFDDAEMVARNLSKLNPTLIIEGGARGADRLAREWAKANGVPYHTEEADWSGLGLSAGHVRNRTMILKFPNAMVMVFPGGKGTRNCMNQAIAHKRVVLRADHDPAL